MRDEAKEEPLVPLRGLEMNVFFKKNILLQHLRKVIVTLNF